jgi:hypothetical protein
MPTTAPCLREPLSARVRAIRQHDGPTRWCNLPDASVCLMLVLVEGPCLLLPSVGLSLVRLVLALVENPCLFLLGLGESQVCLVLHAIQ